MLKTAITLKSGADLEGFRVALRGLLAERVAPEDVVWQIAEAETLFGAVEPPGGPPVSLLREVVELIRLVVCHRDGERYALLYQLVWRIVAGERALLEVASDPLVHRLCIMAKAIRRDIHKMHAFLRFRRVDGEGGERFVAWFEPDHFIVEAVADFFVERYPSFDWSILTPVGSLHREGGQLAIGPASAKPHLPPADDFAAGWDDYYSATFNPARTNVEAMTREMPKKYWRNMPETKLIPDMLQKAPSRVDGMMSKAPTITRKKAPDKALPRMLDGEVKTLAELNAIITASEPLVPGAARAVLGEGPMHPALAFVGEQPGDVEDSEGRPFVGPAGQLLTRAMAEAGVNRQQAYVTNAVKHFKYEQRGKRRIHQKPTTGEVKHYRWWLMREIELVRPKVVVALGATAVLALSGQSLPVTKVRGPFDFDGQRGFVTIHPSYLLRLPDEAAREEAYAAFVGDLRAASRLAAA